MNRQKLLAFVLTMVWLTLFLQPVAVRAEESAEIKAVKVNIETNPPAPPRIVKRIEASVKTVGGRLLIGRQVDEVGDASKVYEGLFQDVLDRVLAGYTVQQVKIAAGKEANVTVTLEPWGERVREVKVGSEFSAADKLFAPLLRQELGDLDQSITAMLLGLPIESLDWADTVAKNSIREIVQDRLPEYRAAVDIIPGEKTEVRLVFSPVGAVVREAAVSMRSESMPNILLYEMRPAAEAFARALRGLPAEFVTRKQNELTQQLEVDVAKHPYNQAYLLNVRAELVPGSDTDILIKAESRRYRVSAEARLDMGRENDNTSALVHAGKFFSAEDELFVEIGLNTNSMKWQVSPGWGRRVGPNTVIGARFNLTDNINYAWLEHSFGGNWRMRVERSSAKDDNEIGLRYKLHDFLSAELVHRPKENFIRMIGQL